MSYSQETFRQFLAIERKRAEHSPRSFVLLLVSLREELGGRPRMPPRVASAIFSALALSVREVDFVGWYKEGRVAGAVLAQRSEPSAEIAATTVKRITTALSGRVPSDVRAQLKVRMARPMASVPRKTMGLA